MDAKEQAVEQVALLLEDIRVLAEKAGQFVLDQAPPLAREIVTYGRVFHTFWAVVCSIVILSCVYLWYVRMPRLLRSPENMHNGELKARYAAPVAIQTIIGVISFIAMIFNAHYCVLAWFAPRLYIVNYVSKLL